MTGTYDYAKLQEEIDSLPYGLIPVSQLSHEMQRYIRERFELGRAQLVGVRPGRIPGSSAVANGYTRRLGVWYFYAGRRGLQAAIHPKAVWTATLKNNPMVRLEKPV